MYALKRFDSREYYTLSDLITQIPIIDSVLCNALLVTSGINRYNQRSIHIALLNLTTNYPMRTREKKLFGSHRKIHG